MFDRIRRPHIPLPERVKAQFGRRTAGLLLALLLEALLVLALLRLGNVDLTRKSDGDALKTFALAPDSQEQKAAPETPSQKTMQQRTQPETPPPVPDKPILPQTLPSTIRLSPQDMAAADISKIQPRQEPTQNAKPTFGPADTGATGDTPRMAGTGPNGEPLYAAEWYRKPYDNELSGYLSTADGPGWGLIACKTEPEYRVDQCVIVDEYPAGSRIANAVLQAAWQFRVRPPRRGGRVLLGEWVGIRIDYGIRHTEIR